MPDPIKMEAAVQAYVAAFAAGSADQVIDLYAEDATVEDPVGTDRHVGREAVLAFYQAAVGTGAKLKLEGPVRIAADCAAFPFSVSVAWEGTETRIDVIDVFRFNDANKIVEMRAFWGPSNSHQL